MRKTILIMTLLLATIAMYGQGIERPFLAPEEDVEALEQDSIPPSIIVEQADNQILDATTQDTILYLNGNVRMYHDSIYMYCDTAQMISNNVNAFGEVSIVKNDSLRVFSDSLYYDGDLQKAYLYQNVVLEDQKNQLFTKSLVYNIKQDYAIYTDTALLRTEKYEIKSKRGIYYSSLGYADFTENVSVDGEKTQILTDSMRFYNRDRRLDFKSPVRINQEDRKIYAQSGYYYLKTRDALFEGNAQLVTDKETITADKIEYDGPNDTATFSGNASIQTEKEYGTGDKIIYDKKNDVMTIIGNGTIKNDKDVGTADRIIFDNKNKKLILKGHAKYVTPDQVVEGEEIEYHTDTEALNVKNNGFLSMPPLLIWSGDIDYDSSTKMVYLKENVIVQDTTNDYTLHGDFVNYNRTTEDVIAYNASGKPWVENISKEDTLYMSGDTLRYITIPQGTDTLKFFKAYLNVEFLNKEISGVGDTLIYNRIDSTMHLGGNALMWKDSTQLKAHTIDVDIKNGNPSHIKMTNNATIMNTPDMVFFNQLQGDVADVYFKGKNIDNIKIKNNVKTLYYIQEKDKSYIGVDKTEATRLNIFFEDKEIRFLKYYEQISSEVLPIEGTDHKSLMLEGAIWKYGIRPKKLEDLLD